MGEEACPYLRVGVSWKYKADDLNEDREIPPFTQACLVVMLYFDLRPEQKGHSKAMHRNEVTHSNGSYEMKSRGRKLSDEMGRAKKFLWYTHRLMHRKRVTCELHDSYFRLITIKHSIAKIVWAIVWALNYYITQSRRKSSPS